MGFWYLNYGGWYVQVANAQPHLANNLDGHSVHVSAVQHRTRINDTPKRATSAVNRNVSTGSSGSYCSTNPMPDVKPSEPSMFSPTLASLTHEQVEAWRKAIEPELAKVLTKYSLKLRAVDMLENTLSIDIESEKDILEQQTMQSIHEDVNHVANETAAQQRLPESLSLEYLFLTNGLPWVEQKKPIATTPEPLALQNKRIVINPGHGLYADNGRWITDRVSYFELLENDINLDLSIELQAKLRTARLDVRSTRQLNKGAGNHSSDNPWWKMGAAEYARSLGAPESVWNVGSNGWARDLNARARYANWAGANALVSLHNNGGGGCGTEIWYDSSNGYQTQSRDLANRINSKLGSRIRTQWNGNWCLRGVKGSAGGYGENRDFRGPAVLVELAFMDNQSDSNALKNTTFRTIAMLAIYDALVEYYGEAGELAAINSTQQYRIISANSGRVLDVVGGYGSDGADIVQWEWNGGNNQRWNLEPMGDGTYRIRARHSGRCLDVTRASTTWGEKLVQWSCHSGDNQRWRLIPYQGKYVLVAKHSSLAVDVNGAARWNGANIIQWGRHNDLNQLWVVEPVS